MKKTLLVLLLLVSAVGAFWGFRAIQNRHERNTLDAKWWEGLDNNWRQFFIEATKSQPTDPHFLNKIYSFEQLNCSFLELSSLEPLQKLTNLRALSCMGNQITSLEPLSGLTKLTFLHCGGNQITSLKPISGLTNLTSLYCGFNQITTLKPISYLPELTLLDCCYNQITTLKPLVALPNLTQLYFEGNPIPEEEIEAFKKSRPDVGSIK